MSKIHKTNKTEERTFKQFFDCFVGSGPSRAARVRKKLSVVNPAPFLKLNEDRILRKQLARKLEAEELHADENAKPQPPDLLVRVLRSQSKSGKWPGDKQLVSMLVRGSPVGEANAALPPNGVKLWVWTTALCVGYIRQFPEFHDDTLRAFELGSRWLGTGTVLKAAQEVLPAHSCVTRSSPVPTLKEIQQRQLEREKQTRELLGDPRWQSVHEEKSWTSIHSNFPEAAHVYEQGSVREQASYMSKVSAITEQSSEFTKPSGISEEPSHLSGDTEVTFTSMVRREKESKTKEQNAMIEKLIWQASTLTGIADSRTKLAHKPQFQNARDSILEGTIPPLAGSVPLWRKAADILESQNAAAMLEFKSNAVQPLLQPNESFHVCKAPLREEGGCVELNQMKKKLEEDMEYLAEKKGTKQLNRRKAVLERQQFIGEVLQQRDLLHKQWDLMKAPRNQAKAFQPGDKVQTRCFQANSLAPVQESNEWFNARVIRPRPSNRYDLQLEGSEVKLRGVSLNLIRSSFNKRAGVEAVEKLSKEWKLGLVREVPDPRDEIRQLQQVLHNPKAKPDWIKWHHTPTKKHVKSSRRVNHSHIKPESEQTLLTQPGGEGKEQEVNVGREKTRHSKKLIRHSTANQVTLEGKMSRLRLRLEKAKQNTIQAITLHESTLSRLREYLKDNSRRYQSSETHEERNHAFDMLTRGLSEYRILSCSTIESVMAWRKVLCEIRALEDEQDGKTKISTLEPIQTEFDDVDSVHVLMNPKRTCPGPRPFIWNGVNYIHTIPTCLDFLAESPQLAEWYGKDFAMHRNPFALVIPLDKRPSTPVKATKTVFLDGKEVQQISRKLAEQRQQEQKMLDESWKRVQNSPKWWPMCDEMLWNRVRRCERVLVQEEEWARMKKLTLSSDHGKKV